jgi:uncharacterized membrane protein (GlpM family)
MNYCSIGSKDLIDSIPDDSKSQLEQRIIDGRAWGPRKNSVLPKDGEKIGIVTDGEQVIFSGAVDSYSDIEDSRLADRVVPKL